MTKKKDIKSDSAKAPEPASKRTKPATPQAYRVQGIFRMGNKPQKFVKEILATDPEEQIYSDLGSRHHVKRKYIKIEKVEALAEADVTDPVIKELLEA